MVKNLHLPRLAGYVGYLKTRIGLSNRLLRHIDEKIFIFKELNNNYFMWTNYINDYEKFQSLFDITQYTLVLTVKKWDDKGGVMRKTSKKRTPT